MLAELEALMAKVAPGAAEVELEVARQAAQAPWQPGDLAQYHRERDIAAGVRAIGVWSRWWRAL